MNAENKITYQDFTERVAKRANISNTEADAYLHELSRTVGDALEEGDEVKLYHFGRFYTTHFDERPGHDPKTGKPLTIPDQTRVEFQPYKALLLAVNWPFRNLRTKMLPEKGAEKRSSTIIWLLLALALLALIVLGVNVSDRMFNQNNTTPATADVSARMEPEQSAAQAAPAPTQNTANTPIDSERPVATDTADDARTAAATNTETTTASNAETSAGSDTSTDTATVASAEPIAPSNIVVESGDTLWGIAASQWGDASWWPVIYSENRADLAARNPDLIETGSSLRIPVLAGSAAQPTDADLSQKAEAYRVVANDYERIDHTRAAEYRQFVNRNSEN